MPVRDTVLERGVGVRLRLRSRGIREVAGGRAGVLVGNKLSLDLVFGEERVGDGG